jgi:hypothetical protein
MRNMLAFLAAATLTVIGVGWYLDWFKFHSVPADTGHRQLSIDVNTSKIGHDLHEAEHKIEQKLTDKNQPQTSHNINPLTKTNPLATNEAPVSAVHEFLPKIDVSGDK